MESWEDDFEPSTLPPVPAFANKWVGEDEEDEVKENWEDEDEEKKEESKVENVESKKSKKKIADKIAERERHKREEMEKRLKELEEEEISPEEKLRRQKESDLKLALETTFGEEKAPAILGDISLPETKEEFESFTDLLTKKLTPLSKNVEYPNFLENLTRNLCATMSSFDIKKIKNAVDNLYLEKQKIEKGEKTRKNKGKGKAKLKLEGDNELSQLSAYVNEYDDYDDFM